MSLYENIKRCEDEAKIVAYKLVHLTIDDFSFSIKLPNNYSLSISIPCDIRKNKFSEGFNYPKVIETLLFHKEKSIFDPEIGYENDNDVKRFYGEERASEDDNVCLVRNHIDELIHVIENSNR
tara:strand:+ start:1961 stop:2329 length:369 start_codon:yes stop_codon:yes gene_type:complete